MHVMVMVNEGTWETAVDVAAFWPPADGRLTLVHVVRDDVDEVMRGSAAGLLGRRRPDFSAASAAYHHAADELLAAAATPIGPAVRDDDPARPPGAGGDGGRGRRRPARAVPRR